jgi:Ca2+/Na+ antiporter
MKMFLFVMISRFVIFVFGLLFWIYTSRALFLNGMGIEWQTEGDDGCSQCI